MASMTSKMNAGMPGADADQKLDEIAGRDRAHHAELQPRLSYSPETARTPARRPSLIQDLVEMRLYDLSQFGKMV